MAKVCRSCKQTKPISEFTIKDRFRRADGEVSVYLQADCKPCRALDHRLTRHSLSHADWEKLCEDYSCGICGKAGDGELHVDHDHNTGKVRGLLCPTCNKGIGLLYDDPQLLRNAISYLTKEVKS